MKSEVGAMFSVIDNIDNSGYHSVTGASHQVAQKINEHDKRPVDSGAAHYCNDGSFNIPFGYRIEQPCLSYRPCIDFTCDGYLEVPDMLREKVRLIKKWWKTMIVDILHLVALHLPELLCLVCLGTSCYIPLMVTWNLVRQMLVASPIPDISNRQQAHKHGNEPCHGPCLYSTLSFSFFTLFFPVWLPF